MVIGMFGISTYAVKAFDFFRTSLMTSLSNIEPTTQILFDIAIIVIVAAMFALIGKLSKIELIPMYILAGLIIGPIGFGLVKQAGLINALSELGIAFLLFVAGMEINARKLRETTKTGVIIGVVELFFMFLITFGLLAFFRFGLIEMVYIAIAVSLSSTVVVVKLLADKRELATLHSRLIITILIVQDIFSILLLSALSSFSLITFMASFGKLIIIGVLALFFKKVINESLFKFCAKSQELMLIVPIALLFLFSFAAGLLGLSIIIGSFLAGLTLADSEYKIDIEAKMRPLRDFFIVLFFVSLGMQLSKFNVKLLIPFVVLIVLVIVVKPILTFMMTRILSYKRRTSILTGLSIGQMSEFGLIIALQGLLLGHLSRETFSLIVFATIITIGVSPYVIRKSHKVYEKTKWFFKGLDRISSHREKLGYMSKERKSVLLVGCHRMGSVILDQMEKMKSKLIVLDFNPETIKSLMKKKISCIYGDAENPEVIEAIKWDDLAVVISTVPSLTVNKTLLKVARKNPNAITIMTSEKVHNALDLYSSGADYVILPYGVGGEQAYIIMRHILGMPLKERKKSLSEMKKKHIKQLELIHRLLY